MSAVPLDLSMIVPVRDEEENVLPLALEVAAALNSAPWTYELVFVDDGSTDGTWTKVQQAQRQNPHVRGLRHARSLGQSAALWTGIRATSSPLLATMDGDRQNDPADFPKLLAALEEHDFVCGVRARRQDNLIRRASAKVARVARKWVLGVDFADTGCAVRVFKRSVLDGVFPFNGWHRFLPVLVHGTGAKTLQLPINHRPRVAGLSKYGLWNRLGRGVADLLAVAWYQRRRLPRVQYEELKPDTACEVAGTSDLHG
jgi:dolichol-phosphate mannosyltransferase